MYLSTKTKTIVVASISVLFLFFLYLTILDFAGITDLSPFTLAMRTLPLLIISTIIGAIFSAKSNSKKLSLPWFILSLMLFIYISLTLAYFYPHEINESLSSENKKNYSPLLLIVMRGILISFVGILYLLVGLMLQRNFMLHASIAYKLLLRIAPVILLSGIIYMLLHWKDNDSYLPIINIGKGIPYPGVILPILSLFVVLYSEKIQYYSYVIVGMSFFASSLWYLNHVIAMEGWPIFITTIGITITALTTWREIHIRMLDKPSGIDKVKAKS